MGILKLSAVFLSAAYLLLTSCSSTPQKQEKALAQNKTLSDEEHILQALNFQKKQDWASAEKEWNSLAPQSVYFPKAFYETQKLSYRLENWNIFFAKAELYNRAFKKDLYCPELYLLQSFAYTRNCLFNDAEASLQEAIKELSIKKNSQCSSISKNSLLKQIEELRAVLIANKKLKVSTPVTTDKDPLNKSLWPVSEELFEKVQKLPLQEGLAIIGVEVKNQCSQ